MQPEPYANRPWSLTGPAGDVLRIGARQLPLAEIRGFEIGVEDARDYQASLLNYSIYSMLAAVFLVLVVQAGWRERFLIATCFFALIAVSGLIDIGQANRIRLFRLRMRLVGGGTLDFVSAEAWEVEALAATLRQAGRG